jgi:hypothetical protein
MSDVIAWLLDWRNPWHWWAYLFPPTAAHVSRRWRERSEPARRRRSIWDRVTAIVNRIGEAGAAEVTLAVERLEATARDAKAAKTIAAKDREIALLRQRLSELDSSPASPSPSPTTTNPPNAP